jgi:hypothetical protein
MKKIKVALLGCGDRGCIYADYALRNPDDMEVVAVTDLNKLHKDEARVRYSLPEDRAFDSVEEFIESWQKIDKKTFSYFSTFNKNHYTVFNLNKTKQELTETYNQTKQNTKTYKTFLNQEINKLKVKQTQLKTTLFQLKTKLLKADIKRNLFIKLKKMILSFPIDIANIINDDKVYSNINSTTEFILINGIKVNSITYAVSVLEKLIFNFYFEINTFKSKGMINLQQYNEWKLIIDRHNRERKNKQNRI